MTRWQSAQQTDGEQCRRRKRKNFPPCRIPPAGTRRLSSEGRLLVVSTGPAVQPGLSAFQLLVDSEARVRAVEAMVRHVAALAIELEFSSAANWVLGHDGDDAVFVEDVAV